MEQHHLSRRRFLLGSIAVLSGMAGVAGYAYALEPHWLEVVRLDLPIPELPGHLDGYTIGVLADLHLGRLASVKWGHQVASRLAALQPDLVVAVGDMVGNTGSHEEQQRMIDQALDPVRGAYGVLGNWDYFGGQLSSFVKRQTAVRLLVNEGVEVAPGLWLAGVDDGLWGQPDVDEAVAGAPEGAVRILLAHEPDLADRVRPEHRIALQISSHTHGGRWCCRSWARWRCRCWAGSTWPGSIGRRHATFTPAGGSG